MDTICKACGECWDADYMRHDVVYEIPDIANMSIFPIMWGMPTNKYIAEIWQHGNFIKQQAIESGVWSDIFRIRFSKMGWEFGHTTMDIRHCPACPSKNATI